MPTFHEFASEWYAGKAQEGLGERTLEDYRWALTYHLLPYFGEMTLSQTRGTTFGLRFRAYSQRH